MTFSLNGLFFPINETDKLSTLGRSVIGPKKFAL